MADHRSRPLGALALIFVAATLMVAALLAACGDTVGVVARAVPGGDVQRGQAAMGRYGCGSCHTIPGVNGANARVGPPLNGWAGRTYIAGELANTPDNLIRWLKNPQEVEPGTAMPYLGVSETDARDIAAYLYTLR